MKLFDFSFKERLLNFLKEKNVDLNDIKSIILAVKKDDKNYVINFIPKQQGDFNFSNLLYKNKEMSKQELSGYENSPDIAVVHFDKNNNLQLSSDMFFTDSKLNDIPFMLQESTDNKSVNFMIEDNMGKKHSGKILILPTGCKVVLDGKFVTLTNYDINGTLRLVERNAKMNETIEDFISSF